MLVPSSKSPTRQVHLCFLHTSLANAAQPYTSCSRNCVLCTQIGSLRGHLKIDVILKRSVSTTFFLHIERSRATQTQNSSQPTTRSRALINPLLNELVNKLHGLQGSWVAFAKVSILAPCSSHKTLVALPPEEKPQECHSQARALPSLPLHPTNSTTSSTPLAPTTSPPSPR